MSNQQGVKIANSSPVHTASGQDEPSGSQALANQVEENPNRKRTAVNSPTTSSENRNEAIQQPIHPQRRIHLPDCARCKKPPVEPHGVYCCGSMYCHTCLVSKMAAAASEGGIATCDNSKKPMGENPTQQKTSRAETVAADSSEFSQPPAKRSRIDSQPQFQENTMMMNDGGYSPLTAAAPNLEEKKAKPPPTKPILVGGTCTICWGGSKIPVQTNCCSKIFCRECLVTSMNLRPRCPSCNRVYAQKDISQSYVEMTTPKPVEPHPVLEVISHQSLDEFTLSAFIQELSSLREQKYKEERNQQLRTLSVGLGDFIRKSKVEMSSIQRQMDAAVKDKKIIDGGYSRECSLYGGKISAVSQLSVGGSSLPTLPISRDLEQQTMVDKDERSKSRFDAFCTSYYDIFNKYNNSNEEPNSASQNRINSYHSDVSEGITKYRKLTKVANLNLYCDPTSMNSIFSIEFDTTGERFAVAGVTRKIKIFNFDNFFKNQTKRHVPLNQLYCQAAISSTSWNPVQNEILANSDYDGHVSLWDAETGQVVRSFHEHEKSCWTVNFNNVDPKLMVSGSEDAKVKIWNANCDRSMANIRTGLGVCSVCFHPNERNQLIFGSEDHKVYLYDIRNVERPLKVFQGHNKTVSYVKFLSNTTIVSASADSSLRVWDTVERRCLKVLKGHTNKKNFVGLSSNGDHILCGSENGRVFLYYKEHDEPITSYVLGKDGSTNDDDAEGFVSSVCWKKGTNYALAANSHGRVHLLEASRRVD